MISNLLREERLCRPIGRSSWSLQFLNWSSSRKARAWSALSCSSVNLITFSQRFQNSRCRREVRHLHNDVARKEESSLPSLSSPARTAHSPDLTGTPNNEIRQGSRMRPNTWDLWVTKSPLVCRAIDNHKSTSIPMQCRKCSCPDFRLGLRHSFNFRRQMQLRSEQFATFDSHIFYCCTGT